jgi:mRNA-degrading endonuclease toxin of MazEF toxin-antitoxin module
MPRADRGSVWIVDLGLAAKVRPCVVLSVPTDPVDRVLSNFGAAHDERARNAIRSICASQISSWRGSF